MPPDRPTGYRRPAAGHAGVRPGLPASVTKDAAVETGAPGVVTGDTVRKSARACCAGACRSPGRQLGAERESGDRRGDREKAAPPEVPYDGPQFGVVS